MNETQWFLEPDPNPYTETFSTGESYFFYIGDINFDETLYFLTA